MEIYYVYQLRRSDQDLPFYIGKGKNNRIKDHFSGHHGNNKLKRHIFQKADMDKVDILAEKIFENMSEENAYAKEKEMIKFFGRRDLGTGTLSNMTDGGEGGSYIRTMNTRIKLSQSKKGVPATEKTKASLKRAKKEKPQSAESRLLHSQRMTGSGNPMYGTKGSRYNKTNTKSHKDKNMISFWNKNSKIWLKSQDYYDIWINHDKPAYVTLAKLCGLDNKKALQSMVRKFIGLKNGPWIPNQCDLWLNWIK